MSRIFSIVIAIVVAVTFTATAPGIFPVLAENQLLLRAVRIALVLTTLTLVRVLLKSASQMPLVDQDQQTMTYR